VQILGAAVMTVPLEMGTAVFLQRNHTHCFEVDVNYVQEVWCGQSPPGARSGRSRLSIFLNK